MILFITKAVQYYRKAVFYKKIGYKPHRLRMSGAIEMDVSKLTIGKNVRIFPGVVFWGEGEIIIGDNTKIGHNTIIFANSTIKIGSNSAIAADCYLIDSNHGIEKGTLINSQPFASEPLVIGDDVWISAGCKIVKGAQINNGAIIGALSFVNDEIPANAIAVGSPAKIKKYRSITC